MPEGGAERSQRASAQHVRIRAIAARLFAAKGFHAVGVAEIGAAAGLGRGALYYHIGSKEELLYDIARHYIAELAEGGQAIATGVAEPVERIRQLSRHLMSTIGRRLPELTVCFRELRSLSGEHRRTVAGLHIAYQRLWAEAFAEGAAQGLFRPLPKVALKGMLGMYFYSFLWLDPQGRHTPEEIGDIFSGLILRAALEYGRAIPPADPGPPAGKS